MMTNNVIAPTDLRDFLKAAGWSVLNDALADRLYVLSHVAYARRQLVFPMDASAADYRESVYSVVSKFSEMAGTTIESVLARVQSLRDDVLRLRILFEGNDNVLPLSFASTLVSSMEKLLKAAACTALRPKTYHPRLALSEATQFVDRARFGQTESGSFILRVACPINDMEVQSNLDLDDGTAPFIRKVTLSLFDAVSQLAAAIEADALDSLVDHLKNASDPLISSNLCEAISAMHDDRIDNSLDFGFDWSSLRAVPARASARPILFQRDYFSRVEEVQRELRNVELDRQGTFIGTVERLDGDMGTDGHRSGGVVLALLLPEEGETVRASTILSAENYAKADRAHMASGAYVSVTGCLRPGRQPRQLTEIVAFEVLS